MMSLILE